MKLYKTTITPLSSFGTTLRGDTLFGQLCWACKFIFGENELNELLSDYESSPFLIVSDAFASGYLPKPTAPLKELGANVDDKKQVRKQIWLSKEYLQKGEFSNAVKDDDLIKDQSFKHASKTEYTIKNSINRLTFATGDGDDGFSPYSESETFLNVNLDVYFLIDERKFSLDKLQKALTNVANVGYGKNASIGKGRFSFCEFEEIILCKDLGENTAFVTLSPSVLFGYENVYYEPFTRFGKHGASLANDKPFKAPLLLADTKALIKPNSEQKVKILSLGYVGKGIKKHSAHEETVHQGYAIVASTILKAQK